MFLVKILAALYLRMTPNYTEKSDPHMTVKSFKWTFNADKCNSITVRPGTWVRDTNSVYMMGVKKLGYANVIKDLGVIVDETISRTPHIRDCIKKANSKVWLLVRNLGF